MEISGDLIATVQRYPLWLYASYRWILAKSLSLEQAQCILGRRTTELIDGSDKCGLCEKVGKNGW
jgi:hypothetical protein